MNDIDEPIKTFTRVEKVHARTNNIYWFKIQLKSNDFVDNQDSIGFFENEIEPKEFLSY